MALQSSSPLDQLAASASELRASQGSPTPSPLKTSTNGLSSISSISLSGSPSPPSDHSPTRDGKLRVDLKSEEDRCRKRQLRLLKNRQSAALSRQRKKEYITDLEHQSGGLVSENLELKQKIAKISSLNIDYKAHIEKLEKQITALVNENKDLKMSLSGSLLPPQDPHPPHHPHEPSSILAAISKASA